MQVRGLRGRGRQRWLALLFNTCGICLLISDSSPHLPTLWVLGKKSPAHCKASVLFK